MWKAVVGENIANYETNIRRIANTVLHEIEQKTNKQSADNLLIFR